MKNIFMTSLLGLFAIFNLNAQIITPMENTGEQAQTQQMEQLIVGIWVAEGNPYSYRNTYHSNETMSDYTEGEDTQTYYWAIFTGSTPSGLKISHLIIQNTQDSTVRYEYEIDIINNERMILVYNNGIGLQRNLYFRQ